MCMACVLSRLVQYYCSELPFPVIEGIYLVGSCVQSFTHTVARTGNFIIACARSYFAVTIPFSPKIIHYIDHTKVQTHAATCIYSSKL